MEHRNPWLCPVQEEFAKYETDLRITKVRAILVWLSYADTKNLAEENVTVHSTMRLDLELLNCDNQIYVHCFVFAIPYEYEWARGF